MWLFRHNLSVSKPVLASVVSILLGWMLACSASAMEQQGLFNADVAAADDSAAERLRVEMQGLSAVLVRVSGRASILNSPAVATALHNPEAFLLQFSMATNPENDPTQPRLFKLRFDPRAVTQFLKNNRLPLWSSNRPPLLFWWLDETGSVISRNATSGWLNRLQKNAIRRGLPVQWPFGDQQDHIALKPDDIAASVSEPINAASLRYISGPGTGVVLAAKVSHAGSWQAQVILLLEGKGTATQITASSEDELAQRVVDYAADNIADRFALALSNNVIAQGQIRLVVDNLRDFASASQLSDYLRKVTAIKSARLISLAGNTATYELSLESDLAQMKQALQLDQKLAPADAVGANDLAEMHYLWNSH